MAFKTLKEQQDMMYGNPFVLRNDGDNADVIILYNSMDDVMTGPAHYITSDEFSGYVHCLGRGCPACAAGLKPQSKLFIPVYNIEEDQLQFFDRGSKFVNVLLAQVFNRYANLSQFVFNIARRGVAGSIDTKYEFTSKAANTVKSYDEILAENNVNSQTLYDLICKDVDATTMARYVAAKGQSGGGGGFTQAAPVTPDQMPAYNIAPRASANPAPAPAPGMAQLEGLPNDSMSDLPPALTGTTAPQAPVAAPIPSPATQAASPVPQAPSSPAPNAAPGVDIPAPIPSATDVEVPQF